MPQPPSDTDPRIEAMLIAGYRAMSPAEKLERVAALNRALDDLGRARILKQYGPDIPEREVELRLAALRLGRETMVKVFGWDPEEHGW